MPTLAAPLVLPAAAPTRPWRPALQFARFDLNATIVLFAFRLPASSIRAQRRFAASRIYGAKAARTSVKRGSSGASSLPAPRPPRLGGPHPLSPRRRLGLSPIEPRWRIFALAAGCPLCVGVDCIRPPFSFSCLNSRYIRCIMRHDKAIPCGIFTYSDRLMDHCKLQGSLSKVDYLHAKRLVLPAKPSPYRHLYLASLGILLLSFSGPFVPVVWILSRAYSPLSR